MTKRSGTKSQMVLVISMCALMGCDDDVSGEGAFSAFEASSEAACDCYASYGYGSKGSCLTDIDYNSEDRSTVECVDELLSVYGQPARVALDCEADAARERTQCLKKVNACGISLISHCEDEHEDALDACPEYPTGFIDDVSECN